MIQTDCRPGVVVVHQGLPDEGPGIIRKIDASRISIQFARTRSLRSFDIAALDRLQVAPDQTLEISAAPSTRTARTAGPREVITLDEVTRRFQAAYPLGFTDPKYLADERADKVNAHEKWDALLGGGKMRALLDAGGDAVIRDALLAGLAGTKLLFSLELVAFREALGSGTPESRKYWEALSNFVAADAPDKSLFEAMHQSLVAMPVKNVPLDKWPIVTLFPFLARPDLHMFMKPQATQVVAAALEFDLAYTAKPNWETYQKLLDMSRRLTEVLSGKPEAWLHPADLIDVQSLIGVVAKAR